MTEKPTIHPCRIAVIVVAYNSLQDLRENLTSWRTALQDYPCRFYVIDNHSTDGSHEFLTSQAAKTSDMHLWFNESNLGYTAAINQGIRMAGECEYLLLLNPDIQMPQNVMTVLLAELQRFPDIGLIAPQMRFPNNSVQSSCRRFPRLRDVFFDWIPAKLSRRIPGLKHGWKMADFDHGSSRDVEQPMGAFQLIRREVIQQIGLLDERFFMFFSDVDFCRRVIDKGWKIRFCSDVFVLHAKGASVRRRRQEMIVSSHRSFVAYLAKYKKDTVAHKFGILVVTLLLLIILLPRLLLAKAAE